ncbi:hypothetical protein M409DRAFT_24262 [Zasmidium cellare ATCC 36951]|uniref:Uncharacterized protein n=1 Tax=Zasmidium cellare ATCC 36951 TaxID=1080233 RepID=A0A6A6CHJ4_ZASCE|nr:uncharacterized protein M409DRAFT_24262 [Zasmidium cellare ATCC 36951]KAF2165412.1 hypothetical protein M409DRAFT_24262 [Zasmidium cellare ATCC 36951]
MPSLPALISLGLLLSSVQAIHNASPTPSTYETAANQILQSAETLVPATQTTKPFNPGTAAAIAAPASSWDQPVANTAASSTQSCAASVYLTDPGYSSKAAAYTSGNGAVSTGKQTSGDNSTPTSASSASGGSGEEDSPPSSSSSSNAGLAAALVTSGPLVGAWMVAGGLMLAA